MSDEWQGGNKGGWSSFLVSESLAVHSPLSFYSHSQQISSGWLLQMYVDTVSRETEIVPAAAPTPPSSGIRWNSDFKTDIFKHHHWLTSQRLLQIRRKTGI